jgi:hypothetical protein
MTKETDPNLDPDPNPDPANDNSRAIAPASKGSALASTAVMTLAKLTATFKTVDTTPMGSRPIRPIMLFKSREGGIWAFGPRRTIPEPNSLWAVNPTTFLWGWDCWSDGNKILGEQLVPIDESFPDVMKLRDTGFPWKQAMAVDLQCVSGTDDGTEVVFKTNTKGGRDELLRLIEAVRVRLNGQHEAKSRRSRDSNATHIRITSTARPGSR